MNNGSPDCIVFRFNDALDADHALTDAPNAARSHVCSRSYLLSTGLLTIAIADLSAVLQPTAPPVPVPTGNIVFFSLLLYL